MRLFRKCDETVTPAYLKLRPAAAKSRREHEDETNRLIWGSLLIAQIERNACGRVRIDQRSV